MRSKREIEKVKLYPDGLGLYVIQEIVPYGEFVHIVRAKSRQEAIKIADEKMDEDARFGDIKLLSSKGKSKHLFRFGARE